MANCGCLVKFSFSNVIFEVGVWTYSSGRKSANFRGLPSGTVAVFCVRGVQGLQTEGTGRIGHRGRINAIGNNDWAAAKATCTKTKEPRNALNARKGKQDAEERFNAIGNNDRAAAKAHYTKRNGAIMN